MQRTIQSLVSDRRRTGWMPVACFITLLLLNGCEGCLPVDTPISLDQILQVSNLALKALELLKEHSADTTAKVKDDYADLGEFLREKSVSAPRVQDMERRHTEMAQSADGFRNSLAAAKNNADTLFNLLDKRARQVTTDSLKKEMLDETAHKRSEFNLTLDTTTNALGQLDGYIKKYDDILAYMQQRVAMQMISGYKEDVVNVSAQIADLSTKVQQAIEQGMKLIDPSHLVNAPASETSSLPEPSPTPGPIFGQTNVPSPQQGTAGGPYDSTPAPQRVPELRSVNIGAGTPLMVRIATPIPFGAYPEKEFVATLSTGLTIGGVSVANDGASVRGRVTEAPSSVGSSDYQMRLVLSQFSTPDGGPIQVITDTLVTNGSVGNVLASGTVLRFPLSQPITLTVSVER